MEQVRHRINASQLSQHRGKGVCVLGTITQNEGSGMGFHLKTSDESVVQVEMQRPLDEFIEGLIEVQGTVTQKLTVRCDQYTAFSKDMTANFDMKLYEEAVRLMDKNPSFYKMTD